MADNIDTLVAKLNALLKKQESFQVEINMLRNEINAFRNAQHTHDPPVEPVKETPPVITPPVQKTEPVIPAQEKPAPPVLRPAFNPTLQTKTGKSGWEKFIGENLINKIGIVILVLGVGIGARYAIDKGIITPLTRIVLGYMLGAGLAATAMWLKKNYENYSAVLLSGAMAIMYFITFAAYGFYNLIPVSLAFGLMVAFTLFTVIASLQYNRQVIAIIGLVGAYAVPFLLSDGSGRIVILFSYMAIINAGILVIAYRKYWKPVFYSAFGLTWLIYLGWYGVQYSYVRNGFALPFIFLSIFFFIFYNTILAYKLIKQEKFNAGDVIMILINASVFYGAGYSLVQMRPGGPELLGLFTLANALIHFTVSATLYRRQLADRNLFYMVSGLVLAFITLAVPVQLNGNWVTLVWALQAVALFWVGRTKNVSFYEVLSYPLMVLAFFSLVHDWESYHFLNNYRETSLTPVLNINFLSSLIVIACLGGITWLSRRYSTTPQNAFYRDAQGFVMYITPAMLLLLCYCAVFIEIYQYWHNAWLRSGFKLPATQGGYTQYNNDLLAYKVIWLVNYTLLFASAVMLFNIKWMKSKALSITGLVISLPAMLAFLVPGLWSCSMLRESYVTLELAKYFDHSLFNLLVRYLAYALALLLLYAAYRTIRQPYISEKLRKPYELVLHLVLLWLASSEMIHWISLTRASYTYKLHLSILWGCYALLLISLGIWKKKQHLRIAAMVLFGITLAKLFLYDMSALDTIAKTIVFVILGVLLLIISFLYNKFKHTIEGEKQA